MQRLTLLRTDLEGQWHLYRNNHYPNCDSYSVELYPGQSLYLRGLNPDMLWREVLASIARLQKRPSVNAARPYRHFAYITMVDSTRDLGMQNLAILQMIAEMHPSHDERVDALCRAADLLEPALA
jgi:hypothetical protein